jgi:Na+-driven multidrug efflux pump
VQSLIVLSSVQQPKWKPTVTAIEVSRESAQGNQEGVQEAVCRALFVGIVFACLGSGFLMIFTDKALNTVLKSKSLMIHCIL